jgi:hypothetical protein
MALQGVPGLKGDIQGGGAAQELLQIARQSAVTS